MKRFSATVWLCMRLDGELLVRATRAERPALHPGEIAMQLDLDVPRALFDQPMLHAKVIVPDQDYNVTATCQAMERAIKRELNISARFQESPF